MKEIRIVPVDLKGFHTLLQIVEEDFVSQADLSKDDIVKIHAAIDRFCKDMDASGLSFLKGVITGFICLDSMLESILLMNDHQCPTDLN